MSQEAANDAWQTIRVQNHLHCQLSSSLSENLMCSYVELQNFSVNRYEGLWIIRMAPKYSK